MKKGAYLIAVTLVGCANPYTQFYQGQPDARIIRGYDASVEDVKVYSTNDLDRDIPSLERKGFIVVGNSSFNAGTNAVHQFQVVEQAKKVGAQIVLLSSKYTHTIQGAAPLVLPQTSTAYTTGNATAYGPAGVTNAYGSATTTTYGTQTVMMPYSIQRADFAAIFLAKTKTRLGIFVIELDDAARQRLQSNKGLIVRNVMDGSPAFDADILPGDVVLEISHEPMQSVEHFVSVLDRSEGKNVPIKINRAGAILVKDVPVRAIEMVASPIEGKQSATNQGNGAPGVKTKDYRSYKGSGPPDEWMINK